MEHKSRYPRQADSQYYPSNETEAANSSLKKETEENSEEGSKTGFTFKLKGYYDKTAKSYFVVECVFAPLFDKRSPS